MSDELVAVFFTEIVSDSENRSVGCHDNVCQSIIISKMQIKREKCK